MQKEASRAGYIGVWFLAGVISGLSSGAVSSIMIAAFIRANGSGSIIAVWALPAIVGALAWCLTYVFFPSINTLKVVPYHIVAGLAAGVGFVISLSPLAASYPSVSSGFTGITVPVTILLWIAVLVFLTKQAETFEANNDRYKSEPSPESTATSQYKRDSYRPVSNPTAAIRPSQVDQPSTPATNRENTADERKVVPDMPAEDDEVNLSDFPKAQKAIEYRPEVLDAWTNTQALPVPFQRRFIKCLESDPRSDPQKIAASLEEEFKMEQRPFDDEAANDALEEVRTISPEAVIEFKNVYEILGDTVPLPELLQRIEASFGPIAKKLSPEEKKTAAITALNKAIRHVDASGITDALTALGYEIQPKTSSGGLVRRYFVTEPKEKGGRSFNFFNDHALIEWGRRVSSQYGQSTEL
jgi:hypothetical protein